VAEARKVLLSESIFF